MNKTHTHSPAFTAFARTLTRRNFLGRAGLAAATIVTTTFVRLGLPAPEVMGSYPDPGGGGCRVCYGNCGLCASCNWSCTSPDGSCTTWGCCGCPNCDAVPSPCVYPFFVAVWSCNGCAYPSGSGDCPSC